MKYLKFLSQKNIDPLGDYFQTNFTFFIYDSSEKAKNNNEEIKIVEVRITGREDASLRANYSSYELEPALFTIAINYLISKIKSREKIKDKENVFPNATKYLFLDSEPLEEFHNKEIKIEID